MSLQELLRNRKEEILARFIDEVQVKGLAPPGLTRPVLADHIPIFLDEIREELAEDTGGPVSTDATDVAETARQHGEQRWNVGYDVESLVREYGVLLHVILQLAQSLQTPLTTDEADALARYLNVGIREALAEYARSRDEELTKRHSDLQFLTEAGEVLGSSLDYQSTLAKLTRLLVPRLADFCIVQLDGSVGEATVLDINPSRAALLSRLLKRFPLETGENGYANVVRTGKSLLVEALQDDFLIGMAQAPEHLAGLRRLGAASWMVVPLKTKTSSFGTITLAMSESGRRYRHDDLVLAEDLARRAAVAVDNARLFELSKGERSRAEAAARAKDEFVAMISHELRTPLNVIIGWVRLLRSGTLPEKTREQALAVVERNANAQSQLVADLLDISRAITGNIRLDPAQVDFRNVIDLVVEDARLALEAKRVKLSVDITAEDTVMRGDGERLKQVVANVLLNAIKFTPKDGEVSLRLRRVESELELTISDNGIGIVPEFLPYVFETFRQSDSRSTRTHGGLGLGLSIVKHLVELHGGSIEASSEGRDRGATFVVHLPISPVISTTVGVGRVPAATPERPALSQPEALAAKAVLIVDDEPDARALLRVVLESSGMTVLDAESATQALDTLEREQVDLLVSDIGMPKEDGYSLIRRLRASTDAERASIPALALTAFARNEDRARALLEGFDRYLTKPVEPAELVTALAELAASRR